MVNSKNRRLLPPYLSYRTFRNFIEGLQQGIPNRLDRSYLGERFASSTGTHLVATLRFLGLIDAGGTPTSRLRRLVSTKDDQRAELFKEITSEAYGFLLGGSFDPQTATYAQLQEIFQDRFPSTSDVGRKCIKFFVALASDSGVRLSPFINERFRTAHRGTGTKVITKRTSIKVRRNSVVPQTMEHNPQRIPWDEMLLTKFPTFDPAWSDEVKLKWFEAFDQLLKESLARSQK